MSRHRQQISKKHKISQLMAEGGSLSGFPWPKNCGDFDIRIAADGTWFYRNSPIDRPALVKLFATVLQRDGKGKYWLVTPVERGLVTVEDAPFVIVEMEYRDHDDGTALYMRTNLDHWVMLDVTHALTIHHDKNTGEDKPYVHIRDNLHALVNRAVYYELVETAEWVDNALIIKSGESIFTLGKLENADDN